MTENELLSLAKKARENSYSPYSGFAVGAALLTSDGRVFLGTNLENASYSLTLCAERAGFAAAITAGARDFSMLAVVGGKAGEATEFCPPCGACLQVLSEFCPADFPVALERDGAPAVLPLSALLPITFNL